MIAIRIYCKLSEKRFSAVAVFAVVAALAVCAFLIGAIAVVAAVLVFAAWVFLAIAILVAFVAVFAFAVCAVAIVATIAAAAACFAQTHASRRNFLLGFLGGGPERTGLNFFAGFKSLVLAEEVIDFLLVEFVHIVNILNIVEARICRHAKNLVVTAGFVFHMVKSDCATLDYAAGENRIRNHNQSVERIAVFSERAFDVTVIVGVLH